MPMPTRPQRYFDHLVTRYHIYQRSPERRRRDAAAANTNDDQRNMSEETEGNRRRRTASPVKKVAKEKKEKHDGERKKEKEKENLAEVGRKESGGDSNEKGKRGKSGDFDEKEGKRGRKEENKDEKTKSPRKKSPMKKKTRGQDRSKSPSKNANNHVVRRDDDSDDDDRVKKDDVDERIEESAANAVVDMNDSSKAEAEPLLLYAVEESISVFVEDSSSLSLSLDDESKMIKRFAKSVSAQMIISYVKLSYNEKPINAAIADRKKVFFGACFLVCLSHAAWLTDCLSVFIIQSLSLCVSFSSQSFSV